MTVNLPPLLNSDRVQYSNKIESKKSAFDCLTTLLAKGQSEITKNEIFDALIAREKLGSTSIANGIAIPRARVNITNPRAALLVLKKGLTMNSADKQPVTFFLAVLIPQKNSSNYANILKKLNIMLTSKATLEKLTIIKNPKLLADHLEELLKNNE